MNSQLNDTDLLVLDKLKDLNKKNGRHAEEWVMRNYLHDIVDKRDISNSLRKLHRFGLIKTSPLMNKAWIVNIENDELEQMKKSMPKPNNSRPEMTMRLMDGCMRKEEERTRKKEFTSSEMVDLFENSFGKPREKDPDRKIRTWGSKKLGLYDRHGIFPNYTYSIPRNRRKELYFEKPLFAYTEE